MLSLSEVINVALNFTHLGVKFYGNFHLHMIRSSGIVIVWVLFRDLNLF